MSLSPWDELLFVGSLTLYSVIGVTGNIFILIVYLKKSEKLALAGFIRILGIMDLLVCALIIPYTIAFELHHVRHDFVCRFFELLRHVSILAANFTLLAIAVERYYAVCRPLRRLSEEQIAKGITVIVIVSVIMAVPSVFMFAVFTSETEMTSLPNNTDSDLQEVQQKIIFCHFTTQYLGEGGTLFYQGFLVLLAIGETLLLAVFYFLVYRTVWKRSKLWKLNQVAPIGSTQLPSISVTKATEPTPQGTSVSTPPTSPSYKRRLKKVSPSDNRANFLTVSEVMHDSPKARRIKVSSVGQTNFGSDNSPHKGLRTKATDLSQSTLNRSSSFQLTTPSAIRMFHGNVPTSENWKQYHHKTATMLFVCTLVFVITWIPFWLDIFNITKSVPFRFQFFISYASNPLIYGIVNKNVRISILSLFSKCCAKKR